MSTARGSGSARPGLHLLTTVSHGLETYLAGQPRRLHERFDVTLVSSPSPGLHRAGRDEGVAVAPVPMTRRITPVRDARAAYRLFRLFRRDRPQIVQTYSPKAGLVGMLAARAAGVPVRVHGIIGLPLMEAHGMKLQVLRFTERLTYAHATHLICNSVNLRLWIHQRLSTRPIEVIGQGSVNGVDTHVLQPATRQERQQARRELDLPDDACLFVFIGRLVRDKGVAELVEAFTRVHRSEPRSRLLLVGQVEDESLPGRTREAIESHTAIIHTGWREQVGPYYAAADVVVLPSYREGMPQVLLEAAACGLPVVATDINGCNEVVLDGVNGLLVPVRDVAALTTAMNALLPVERRRGLGRHGRALVEAHFDHVEFCAALVGYYDHLLEEVA